MPWRGCTAPACARRSCSTWHGSGSGAGTDVGLIAELHAAFGDLELLAGGGVRDVEDLRALRDAGAAGALVATALHSGVIGRRELAGLSPGA